MGKGGIVCYIGENKRRKIKFEYFGSTINSEGKNIDITFSTHSLA